MLLLNQISKKKRFFEFKIFISYTTNSIWSCITMPSQTNPNDIDIFKIIYYVDNPTCKILL